LVTAFQIQGYRIDKNGYHNFPNPDLPKMTQGSSAADPAGLFMCVKLLVLIALTATRPGRWVGKMYLKRDDRWLHVCHPAFCHREDGDINSLLGIITSA